MVTVRSIGIAAILLGASTTGIAQVCDVPPPGLECPVGTYSVFVIHAGVCPSTNQCANPLDPPNPVELYCHNQASGLRCEAWPFSTRLSYSWSTTGALVLPQDLAESVDPSVAAIACASAGRGTVTVSVATSTGAANSATRTFDCEGP